VDLEKSGLTPFNIGILNFTPERAKALPQVTALDTFEGATQNFHPDGLFSIRIFGANGAPLRDQQFGQINIKISIIHPFVLYSLYKLRGAYKDLVHGKGYFQWDEKEKDFIPSNPLDGQTGFQFFVEHWKDIDFKRTTSKKRDDKIAMIEKYKAVSETSRILVVPAGIRDLSVDQTGRFKQSEVNDFYRSMLSISNIITEANIKDPEVLNNTRVALQNGFCKIYDFFYQMIEGKRGFIQGKFAARNVYYGTRNVFTAMDYDIDDLGDHNGPGINHTMIGITQQMHNLMPLVRHKLLTGIVERCFSAADNRAYLIDPQTYKRELINISPELTDKWTTTAGLDRVIKMMLNKKNRTKPVMVHGRYLALVYQSDRDFKIFFDIDDFPRDKGYSDKDIRPLTYVEMFYLSGYRDWNRYPAWITRYPITGIGSIYPSFSYVKTTVRGLSLRELGDDWLPVGDDFVAREYPDLKNPEFFDSMSPSASRLGMMGGDHDGDTGSCNVAMTEEAINEVNHLLNTVEQYVTPMGSLFASAAIDTVNRVIWNMTGD
jgi:hypothetical protein